MRDEHVMLMTDLVDSTLLAERLGDAAAAAFWEAHDRVARDLLLQWRGREIDKSDGFFALFERIEDAVCYVIGWHSALRQMTPLVATRAGLHRAPLILRENKPADIALGAKPIQAEGIAKATAARVMSLARGGQTLLTAEARAALPEGRWHTVCHGRWRLKGIEEPIELFEVGDDEAPFLPPADSPKAYRVVRTGDDWMPVKEIPNNLSGDRDPFVGRRGMLLDIAAHFSQGARLVTVLGLGGSGKTRVALRYGQLWLGDYPGGAWFADLSTARGIDGIVSAVAQALDVPLGRSDPIKQLGSAIAARGRSLVVLDNFEQVAALAEESLGVWLDRAPDARFLVTSRELLNVAGERAVVLGPMVVDEAIELFRTRVLAGGFQHGFDPEDEDALPRLVRLLDCLPLAVELAAARARIMPPRTLLKEMHDRFRLLATGRRDRRSALRATLDWSWDLLSSQDRSTLLQLSVFQGGFSIEAAKMVIDLGGLAEPRWVVDGVQSLVEKSLVRQLAGARFDLLQTVQEYAAERLARSDARIGIPAERHWKFFSSFERAGSRACLVELDNLVVACRRASEGFDASAAASCLVGAWLAMKMVGPFRAVTGLVEGVLRCASLDVRARMKALWVSGRAGHLLGDQRESRESLQSGLSLAVELEDLHWQSRFRCALGEQLTTTGDIDAASAHLNQALDEAGKASDQESLRDALNSLGALATVRGNMAQAKEHYEAALAVAKRTQDPDVEGGLLGNLGEISMASGRLLEAKEYFERALGLVSEAGHRRWEGNIRCNLGLLNHEQGKTEDANRQLEMALQIAREIGYSRLEATTLCNIGIQLLAAGQLQKAVVVQKSAVELACSLGDVRAEGQFRIYLARALIHLQRLEEAAACLGRGEALLRESDDRVSCALLLCERVRLDLELGQDVAARAALAEAQALGKETAVQRDSELAIALERAEHLVGSSSVIGRNARVDPGQSSEPADR